MRNTRGYALGYITLGLLIFFLAPISYMIMYAILEGPATSPDSGLFDVAENDLGLSGHVMLESHKKTWRLFPFAIACTGGMIMLLGATRKEPYTYRQ